MAEINQTIIGKVVSFQVYPSGIISDDFTDVKIVGLTNYEAVTGYIRPAILHASVYPSLPANTPNDYRLYEYVIVRKQDGSITALGLPWIKQDTLTVSSSIEIIAVIRGKGIDDIPRLRQILTQNGIVDFDVTSKSNV